MTLLISLIHKMYHLIKAVAPLEVRVMRVGIDKLVSGHLNTGTDLIACPDHSLMKFIIWGGVFDRLKGEFKGVDDDTYRIIHCWLSQAIDECKGNIHEITRLEMCVQPPHQIKPNSKATASDKLNRSALNHNRSNKQ